MRAPKLVLLALSVALAGSAILLGALVEVSRPAQGGPALGKQIQVDTTEDIVDPDERCSLREAIIASNTGVNADNTALNCTGTLNPDSIRFALGAGTPMITIADELPVIADRVFINGSSGGSTRVELRGTSMAVNYGLYVTSSDVTVKNLVINGFFNGIETFGNVSNISIIGSYIGTDATGEIAMPNRRGIVAGNMDIRIGGTTGVTPGGACTGECNLISGNDGDGIRLPENFGASGFIKGNFIGTDVDGQTAMPNNLTGIVIPDGENAIFSIGGAETGAGNLISGNKVYGINAAYSQQLTIQGNKVGTDTTGTMAIPNGSPNIAGSGWGMVLGATKALVGGESPGARNIISGNLSFGIALSGSYLSPQLDAAVIRNNLIGTQADGVSPLGNGTSGILVGEDATDNTIGGTGADQANIIAFNGTNGITVNDIGGMGNVFANTFRGNSIHSNVGRGIDITLLSGGEVPAPVINSGNNNMAGGTACVGCTVDLWSDSQSEGRIFHGSAAVANGLWLYLGPLTGPNITATANYLGSTSEFSSPFVVGLLATPTPAPTPTPSTTATVTATPTATPTPSATPTPTPTGNASPTPSSTPGAQVIAWGDHNCSGIPDVQDVVLTLAHAAGLETDTGDCPEIGVSVDVENASIHKWGDVDCSGTITALDALKLLKFPANFDQPQAGSCPDVGEERIVEAT